MFGNDDPFERIAREFFGANRGYANNNWIQGEEEDRNIDLIQTNDYVYAIFELPGYKEGDVDLQIRGNELKILARAKRTESDREYISQKLSNGEAITKLLPKFVNPRGYKSTFRNGVLEVCFNKK